MKEGVEPERAQELAGEALAVCAAREDCPNHPKAFFWAVAQTLLDRYLRDEKPRLDATEPIIEEPPGGRPDPLKRLEGKELWELVTGVLDGLDEQVARVAWLRLDGRKPSEIARDVGVSTATERRYWAQARAALEDLVKRLGT